MFKFVVQLLIALFSASVFAGLTLSGVGSNGVSYFDSTTKKIYGGTTGSCPGGGGSNSTCNTCTDVTAGGLKPCNQKNIHADLKINFSVQSSTDVTGKTITLSVGDGTTNTIIATASGGAAGTTASLTATWGDFCARAAGANNITASCAMASSGDQTVIGNLSFFIDVDESGNGTIDPATERIGIPVSFQAISQTSTGLHSQPFCTTGTQASGYGLCSYALETGDSKLVILGDPAPIGNSTPPSNSPAFQAVAFFPFIQPGLGITASGISTGQVQPVIKNFTSGTDLSIEGDPYITGLENFQRYCVFAGQMNLAQNIFGFTTTSLDANKMCKETSEVVGLLDDKHCFISTAAFGSDMATEVQIFRQFRNTFLLTNKYGAEFVKFYYDVGPQAAEFISESEFLKSVTRVMLYPLVGFSWVALNYGILPALLISLMTFICIFNLRRKIGAFFASRKFHEKFY